MVLILSERVNEIMRETKWTRVATGPTKRRSKCEKDRGTVEMEQEQSTRDYAREQKWNQRDTTTEESKGKEKESDRLRKKQRIQGESSGDR